jgi:hypothetical protein
MPTRIRAVLSAVFGVAFVAGFVAVVRVAIE